MQTSEQLLISKIIQEGTLVPVADGGITQDHFLDAKNRRVYKAIIDYKAEHGEVPVYRRLRKDFPRFQAVEVPEPWTDLIKEIRVSHDLAKIEDALSDAVEIYDSREATQDGQALEDVKKTLHNVLKELESSVPNVRDTNLAETGQERWEKYEALRTRTDELLGIPSGFTKLDRALQGFQPGQLIVFVGPPKAGKSTMMLLAALAAHNLHKVPLLVGFEMSNEEQEQRIDSITSGVSHHRLRGGKLNEDERKRLKRKLHTWDSLAPFMLSNDTMNTTTLTGIGGKTEKYGPDVLIIDGVYMMEDENGEKPGSPQALTNITRGSKRMAQNLNIPVIITTQVLEWKMDKKAGITANSVGYSSSFGQDADALIGVENTEDPMIKKIKIVIARNSGPAEFYVRWDWETGEFTELDGNPFEDFGDGDDEYAPGGDF